MVAPDKYTAEKILWIHPWAPNLFSFRLTRFKGFRFTPGQFARLGVKKPDPNNPKNPSGEKIAWRAYSIVSADYDEHLEFYSIVVPGGEFTHANAIKLADAPETFSRGNDMFDTVAAPHRILFFLASRIRALAVRR